jgi:L-2-hydroxyglutarate oxidase LhgO
VPEVRVTVIGGGIVGCAVLDAVARRGLSAVLLEADGALARGTTARNSEVAHGGMYYPAGSLKARWCVAGRRLLRAFCAEAGVGYREFGKLIVAVDEAEVPRLEALHARGLANGVEDLVMLDRSACAALAPDVTAVAALRSPRTAVCDAEGAARALARRAGEHGAAVLTDAPVAALDPGPGGWLVHTAPAGRRSGGSHTSGWVVNAAGLSADRVADLAGDGHPRQVLVKGNYFAVAPRHAHRLRQLVYPVPPADGSSLGVHVCLDLAGQLRLGPDVEPLGEAADPDRLDYGVDPDRGAAFFDGARRFLPWLQPADLTPGTSGVRPRLAAEGFCDFLVEVRPAAGGGIVNLLGIDSPGLTSAMALADHVADLLEA